LNDEAPERRFFLLLYPESSDCQAPPYLTLAIIGACFLTFGVVAVTTLIAGADLPVRWFALLGLAPGAIAWHAPFTYWILHESLWHLSVNMLLLLLFGAALEGSLGAWRFGAFVLSGAAVTGLVEAGAAVYSPAPDEASMIIGASGAVAGVVGMFAARYHSERVVLGGTGIKFSVVPFVTILVLAEIAMVGYRSHSFRAMLRPPAASWAHLAGFLFGILVDQMGRALRFFRRPAKTDATDEDAALCAGLSVELCEDRLSVDPHDKTALVCLPLLLLVEGEDERARHHAVAAVREALERDDGAEAAGRYVQLRRLQPVGGLTLGEAIELAGALAQGGYFEEAVAAYLHAAEICEDTWLRGRALLRAAELLWRALGNPEQAAALLRQILQEGAEEETLAYAQRLLRAMENRSSATGGDSPSPSGRR